MIKIYKSSPNKLQEIKEIEQGSWINVTNPSDIELERLVKETGAPLDYFTDPLDVDERSRIEIENKWVLIIIRAPIFKGERTDIQFTTIPIGIIYTDHCIVTICSNQLGTLKDLLHTKLKDFSTHNKSRFILQLFLRTAIQYLNFLKEINKRTATVQKELHKSMKNEELIKLLDLEKSLVYFTTSLKSNEIIMERLQKGDLIPMNDEDRDFIEDTIIENKQAIEMSNIYSNILSGMMDAFASVISNNLTVVMKFLTSITIILMIPTLIASIYGMNIHLPFQSSPHAFIITIGISIALSGMGIFVFIKRKWF